MNSKFVTAVWIAKFEERKKLTDYVDWKYPDNDDEPVCSFANDTGLEYFDNSFLENVFILNHSELIEQIDNVSFIESYKAELLNDIKRIDLPESNSLIFLSGKEDVHGNVNEQLFDFVPPSEGKGYLQFVGLYKYQVAD